MIVVFGGFIIVVNDLVEKNNRALERTELAVVARSISSEIDTANKVYDGYSREFELPEEILGQGYLARIEDNKEVIVSTASEEYFIFLPVDVYLVDRFGVPTTELKRGSALTITKQGGVINIINP